MYWNGKPNVRKERLSKKICLKNAEQYDAEFDVPTKLCAIGTWAEQYLSDVPAEFRDSVNIDISSTGGYEGSHYAYIEIYYYRPETDEEMDERIRQETDSLAKYENNERQKYAELKAKFGD